MCIALVDRGESEIVGVDNPEPSELKLKETIGSKYVDQK